MKHVISLALCLVILCGVSFAASTGNKYGGSYGANWETTASSTSEDSTIADNILSSEHYEKTASSQINEDDIESLMILIIEKQKESVHVTIKDLIKMRNMYSQDADAAGVSEPSLPQSGADPSSLSTILPNMLPATGVAQSHPLYLWMTLFGVFGLLTTLLWRRA